MRSENKLEDAAEKETLANSLRTWKVQLIAERWGQQKVTHVLERDVVGIFNNLPRLRADVGRCASVSVCSVSVQGGRGAPICNVAGVAIGQ